MLQNLNKFNFPYYSCKRIAKPYPNGPVDQRDSFRVQLCDNFILDLANFHRRLNGCPFSFCGVKLNQSFRRSVVFQWKKYIKPIPYFALKYENYIGFTVPVLLQLKHKRYFNTYSHGVSISLCSICSHTGFYVFNILS